MKNQPEFLNRINPIGDKPKDVSKKKTKVIFYGDAPTCATGFGQVSRNILPALYNSGRYEVDILGINYWGDPHEYPFKIWPMAVNNNRDPYGRQRLQQHLNDQNLDFDILFFLQDTFILEFLPNLIANLKSNGRQFKSVFYYPVDGIPKKKWIESANTVDFPVTYSQFAFDQSVSKVPEIESKLKIISHGINPKVFFPVSAEETLKFRQQFFGVHSKKFVFLNVNRNQQRKDIPATIRAFKEFKKQRPESLLYLHMAGQDQGWNLPEVIKAFDLDITKDVILPQNFSPSTGFPLPLLNMIYNACDAVISTCVGEGWGLCVASDTYICTTKGFLPICELSIGDKVVVGGKDYDIRGVSSSSKDKVYKITLFGNKEIIGSYEHQIPTANKGYIPLGEVMKDDWLIQDKAILSDDVDYIYDLNRFADRYDDHYVWNKMGFSPNNENSISNTMKTLQETKKIVETAIRVYLHKDCTTSSRVGRVVDYLKDVGYKYPRILLPRYVTFNSDFARLLGYYTAEGSNEGGVGIEFSFHRKETSYHMDVQDLMYKFFGMKGISRIRENRYDIRYRSSVLSKFFGELCGIHSVNKHIPLLCLQHREKAVQFLQGYWRGDGHFEKVELSFCTASRQLMEEVVWLLSGFDIFSKVNYKDTKSGSWNIYVNGQDYNLMANILGLSSRHNTFKDRVYLKKEKDCFLVKVKECDSFVPHQEELFYDISIEGKEHFVANGIIVHNSWTEAMAVKKPVIFPMNTCLTEWITEENGFPYPSGGDPDHITILPNDNEVPRPTAHIMKMVEQMLLVHDNAEVRNARAQAGYDMVIDKLIWNKHVNPQWVDLFDRIVAESKSGIDLSSGPNPVLKGEML